MNKKNIKYSSIYFDLDSTLADIEGLDELAGFYNKKKEVAKLTEKSMSGYVRLEDVFSLKLAMIRPTRSDFKKLGQMYIDHVVEDAKETINILKSLKKDVLIMTGNFYIAASKLAKHLGVPDKNVYANKIHFDKKGNYLSFDSTGPLSIAGGKRSLMMILKRENRKAAFIGDGSTDMETKPPVDLFIGYGGVIERKEVRKKADEYIIHKSLSTILPYILTEKEGEKVLRSKYKSTLLKAINLHRKINGKHRG